MPGVIEKFPFAALDLIVLRTGIELEPGRRPAYAGAHWPIGELFNNADAVSPRRNICCRRTDTFL